jgi:hypothetical protein
MNEMTTRRFYAAQAPRGFVNEIIVHSFPSSSLRDAWVELHEDDGDVNSAAQGARTISATRARKILGYRGDAATESFNSSTRH